MQSLKTIAIIGGGPAGAMTACSLAGCSLEVGQKPPARILIFEENQGWEKPCGGALPFKALRRYPFLLNALEDHHIIQDAEFISANGSQVRIKLHNPIVIYSRATINQLLLRQAAKAGAEVIADHIRGFTRSRKGLEIIGRNKSYQADFLVLAAGARTQLRGLLAPQIPARDFMLTFGYFVPGKDRLLRVRFFEKFEGYVWAFPRTDHLSVGICASARERRMPELRHKLHAFMREYGYPMDSAPVFSHLLPALGPQSWQNLRLVGDGWALAGDAGGLADPVTGEGIYYAMRSGELLGESLRLGALTQYPSRVQAEFGRRMAWGSRLAPHFYHGNLLGKPWTTRLVEFAASSRRCERLLQDLVDGSQPYTGLLRRAGATLASGLVEMGFASLRRHFPPYARAKTTGRA
jgi:flavin-dependent dehydrogenase